MTEQERYMTEALRLAKKSAEEGEVPVGCVIVCEGQIVGRGRNRRETKKNALSHAELEAIDQACKTLGGWRLHRCDMYVTLEPCPMCTGAIINARIRTVYYGADDDKAGSCGSVINLFDLGYNHRPELVRGLMKEPCSDALSAFFRALRARRKQEKLARRLAAQREQDLQSIPGVGEDMEQHLMQLGIRCVADLKGKDPEVLYEQECERTGTKIDRCVLYVYRLAVYFAEHETREPEKLKWWYWKNHPYPEDPAGR